MSVISLSSDDDDIEDCKIIENEDEERGHVEETVQVFVDENSIGNSENDEKKEIKFDQNTHSDFAPPDHLEDYGDDPLANCSSPIPFIDLGENCSDNYDNSQNILEDPLLVKENSFNAITSNMDVQDEHDSSVLAETDNNNCKPLPRTSVKCLFKKSEVIDVHLYEIPVNEDLQEGCKTDKPIDSEELQNNLSNPSVHDDLICEQDPFANSSSIPLADDYNKSDVRNNIFKLTEINSVEPIKSPQKDKFQRIAERLARMLSNNENPIKLSKDQTNKQSSNCDNPTVRSVEPNKDKNPVILKINSNGNVSICMDSIQDKGEKRTELYSKNVNQENSFEMSNLKINDFNSFTSNVGTKRRGRKKGWKKTSGKSDSRSVDLVTSTIESIVNHKDEGTESSIKVEDLKYRGEDETRKNLTGKRNLPYHPISGKATDSNNVLEVEGKNHYYIKKNENVIINFEEDIGALDKTKPIILRRNKGNSNKCETSSNYLMLSKTENLINKEKVVGTLSKNKNVVQYERNDMKTGQVRKPIIEREDSEVLYETNQSNRCKRGRKKGWRKSTGKCETSSNDIMLSKNRNIINEKKIVGSLICSENVVQDRRNDMETMQVKRLHNEKGDIEVLNNTKPVIKGKPGRKKGWRKNSETCETSRYDLISSKTGNIINNKQVFGTMSTSKNVVQERMNKIETTLNIEKEDIGTLSRTNQLKQPTSKRKKPGPKKSWKARELSKNTDCSKLTKNDDTLNNKVNTANQPMRNETVIKYGIGSDYTNSPLKKQLTGINSEQNEVVKKTIVEEPDKRYTIKHFQRVEHKTQELTTTNDKLKRKQKLFEGKVNSDTYVSVSPKLKLPNEIHQNTVYTSEQVQITDSNIKSLSCDGNTSHVELDVMTSNTNSADDDLTKVMKQKFTDRANLDVISEDDTSDFDPNLISIEHITNMSSIDLKILKSDFIKNYTKLFDEEAENKCVEMGDFLLLAMKEARNYKLRVKLSDNFTCDKLRTKEIRIAKQNYENLQKLYRKSFEVLFVEFYRRISSALITANQRKNMVVALFLKIFLRASSLSSEFSDCLLDAKLNFVALISKKVFNFPLVFIVFSCNEMAFEKDCCLILEFMKDCSSVNENHLSQGKDNANNKNLNNHIASENVEVNELIKQTTSIKKNYNKQAPESMNPGVVEEQDKNSHNETNLVAVNSYTNKTGINLKSIDSNIVEKTAVSPLDSVHKKTAIIEKETEERYLKYNQPTEWPQNRLLNSNDSNLTFPYAALSYAQNRIDEKSQKLYGNTNQYGLFSQSLMQERLEKEKEGLLFQLLNADPLNSDNSLSEKRKLIEDTNKKNKVLKSDMCNSTPNTSRSDGKSQHVVYNKSPLLLSSVKSVSNQHVPNIEGLAYSFQQQRNLVGHDGSIPASYMVNKQQPYFPQYQQNNSQNRGAKMLNDKSNIYQQGYSPSSYCDKSNYNSNYTNITKGEHMYPTSQTISEKSTSSNYPQEYYKRSAQDSDIYNRPSYQLPSEASRVNKFNFFPSGHEQRGAEVTINNYNITTYIPPN